MTSPANQFYTQKDWGLFAGQFSDNLSHSHLAVQLTLSLLQPFQVRTQDEQATAFQSCLIQTNVVHQLITPGPTLLLLFNPFSASWHLHRHSQRKQQTELPQIPKASLSKLYAKKEPEIL